MRERKWQNRKTVGRVCKTQQSLRLLGFTFWS
nr:MAG TPA: hypothetical protein [Caudoviricetes sp.]